MTRTGPLILALLCAPCALHAQVSAASWFRGGTFMLTLETGGMAFTDFHRSQARPLDPALELGDVRRRVSAHTTFSLGARASYWIVNGLGIRAGIAWAPTSFDVWTHESARSVLDPTGMEEEPDYASIDVWLADAAALVRFPRSFGRVVPYGIVGAGVVRYHVGARDDLPPEARARFAGGHRQTTAVLFGVGSTIPLQRGNLLMNFELTNHLGRSPLDRVEAEEFQVAGTRFRISSESGSTERVSTTSHVRLTFGVTLPFR